MPKIRKKRTKFPDDWDLLSDTLDELEEKMREAELDRQDGKGPKEALWPIFRIHHQQSRFVYEMYFRHHKISRECYDFCLREKYADASLIAKWKKQGFERLCCLQCIQTRNHNFGTTCICRVPKDKLEEDIVVECSNCGCHGCASGD